MLEEDRLMSQYPLFVSFPRTGSQWLNCVMEVYFDRPRLRHERPTFLDAGRTDWMWFHEHDVDLHVEHPLVLYLYRDPVETVYSNIMYDFTVQTKVCVPSMLVNWGRVFAERTVRNMAVRYRDHLLKWLLGPGKARTHIRYDRFNSDREGEFRRICEHFEQPFDAERMRSAFATVTRTELSKRRTERAALGRHLFGPGYARRRHWFMKLWGEHVKRIVTTPELMPFFK